jgi:hypothetical protein
LFFYNSFLYFQDLNKKKIKRKGRKGRKEKRKKRKKGKLEPCIETKKKQKQNAKKKKNPPECETEVPLPKLPKRRDLKGKELER